MEKTCSMSLPWHVSYPDLKPLSHWLVKLEIFCCDIDSFQGDYSKRSSTQHNIKRTKCEILLFSFAFLDLWRTVYTWNGHLRCLSGNLSADFYRVLPLFPRGDRASRLILTPITQRDWHETVNCLLLKYSWPGASSLRGWGATIPASSPSTSAWQSTGGVRACWHHPWSL